MSFKREKIKDYFLLDTGVENIFINEYMASAPGYAVKVYLFALMYADLGIDLTNEEIARHLSMEHEDVLKAWTYWEKCRVIKKIRKDSGGKFDYDVEFVTLKEQLYGDRDGDGGYSREQNAQSLMGDKQIKDMFAAIEKIAGRVISGTEMMEVLSWINDFSVEPEVVVYGYSYCLQRKKKSIKYIGAVIRGWAEEGLTDLPAVEKYISLQDKKQHIYRRIFQALGFSRNPTEEERRIMDTWFEELEFTMDKVLEACGKTSGIPNPSINYVNRVLINWNEEKRGKAAGRGKDLTASEIAGYYEMLRRKDEEEADKRREEVYARVPRIKEIDEEITACSAEISKLIISDAVDRETAAADIKKRVEKLNTEKAFLLTDNGFELDHMDVKYRCPICKDTGMLETGERCQCFGEVTREKIQITAGGKRP
ncbi:MAG TPA: DnaD domain protein [Candidatus Copromorpha excrementigallinarum]|uniref:DnaD domain protein n=1 Tax=Candidatus Allocopromorpha excrementigallinarum TaxID=2840742 RepID=A0A9D1L7Q3_9FIRM|nr:DnaD domain protein [Candidatus Copromorpha excrementigallinarum]